MWYLMIPGRLIIIRLFKNQNHPGGRGLSGHFTSFYVTGQNPFDITVEHTYIKRLNLKISEYFSKGSCRKIIADYDSMQVGHRTVPWCV